MGHVVAAGFSVNDATGQVAVLIKMFRILLLIPVLLIMSLSFHAADKNQTKKLNWLSLVPMFVLFFLLFSVINTMDWLPELLKINLIRMGDFLMLIALAGIGFNLRFGQLKGLGSRILIVGALVFALQIIFNTIWLTYLF